MSEAPKRVVEFGATMRPAGRITFDAVNEVRADPDDPEFVRRGSTGAVMMLAAIAMSPAERRQTVGDAACADELVVWFAMLTPAERRDVIKAAMERLREKAW